MNSTPEARQSHRYSDSTDRTGSTGMNGSDSASRPLDVLVIGAGQAGLAMAWHLARRGVRYLLVDGGPEVGSSWRNRWDSLRLFTPAQYDGLPGSDFPAAPDSYPTKHDVADFLARYAQDNAFPILTRTTVLSLTRETGHFAVHTTQGTLTARHVVVATGPFQQPHIPDMARSFTEVNQLHSAAYRRPSDIGAGQVVVVGAANSGLQIAEDLTHTHRVTVAVGTNPPAVSQRIAGRDLFWWLTRLRLMDQGPSSLIAKRVRARGDLVIGTSTRDLAAAGVEFRPRLVGANGRFAEFADGSAMQPDTVIWATGYRPDYAWIDIPEVTDLAGWPRHEQGRSHAAEGLWFIGLPWQRTRGSALLGFVQRDAAHLDTQIFSPTPAT
jgi:putative flavoprotein involved in K+ transport